jgi:hypothetical protein
VESPDWVLARFGRDARFGVPRNKFLSWTTLVFKTIIHMQHEQSSTTNGAEYIS